MTILAAIDENERSRVVVELAYDLACAYDDELVGLHVVPAEDYEQHRQSLKELPEFGDVSFEQTEESAANFVEQFILDTITDVDTERVRPIGRIGNVGGEIVSVANKLDPRFLVISGRRQSPAGKAVFGNTAQQILLNADCPVVSDLTDSG